LLSCPWRLPPSLASDATNRGWHELKIAILDLRRRDPDRWGRSGQRFSVTHHM
jgi:hypothetical protein